MRKHTLLLLFILPPSFYTAAVIVPGYVLKNMTACTALVLLALPLHVAHGEHSDAERITDESPYTLRPGEVKIGLASVEVGLAGHALLRMIDVGTNPWLWTVNALGIRSYNARAKYEFYKDEHLSLSVRSSFYQMGKGGQRVRLVPVEFFSAVQVNPEWTIGAGYKYVNLSVKGGAEISEDFDALGKVGFSTAQFRGMGEYRLSSLTAFVLRGSIQRYQRIRGEAGVGSDVVDGETGVYADKNLLPKELAFNVSLVAAWSWQRLNIELGLSYGNPEVPGIAAVVPTRTLLPALDLYWRFQ